MSDRGARSLLVRASLGPLLSLVAACASTSGGAAPDFTPPRIDPAPLWDFGDPAASRARFEGRVEQAAPTDAALWRTQVPRTERLGARFVQARAVLSRYVRCRDRNVRGHRSSARRAPGPAGRPRTPPTHHNDPRHDGGWCAQGGRSFVSSTRVSNQRKV